ncbi:MAG: DUF2334 domain-containing protein [Planctomycetes bacterium]|nr:DUF2334 domain-containing protein [Planctomycetota bacterium]
MITAKTLHIALSTLTLTLALTICCAESLKAEDKEPAKKKTPVIILKLDDVTSLAPRWQKCAEFLKKENVKASFGIIGFGLENPSPDLVSWIKKLNDSKLIEFWNHGYKNRSGKDPKGEFESESMEEQLESLKKTQALAKEKLGITLTAFGPHWSGTNKETEKALEQVPDLTSVFYYTKSSSARPWFVFERIFVLENPIFKPNFEFVKKMYEKFADKKDYICMQGHPNQWDDARFEQFTQIVKYFKEQGCTFMTATEYVNSVSKADKK